MLKIAQTLSVALITLLPASAMAVETGVKTFSPSEKTAIEEIIKSYLTKDHPEIVMQAVQTLRAREEAEADSKAKTAVKTAHDKIYNNPDFPVGGNPKGDVTVVEFFDFQCGYCKMSEAGVEKLLNEDKDIKFIYVNYPILGPGSTAAARAALASVNQGKYKEFHDALMGTKDHFNDDIIMKIAKDIGLDTDKLKKDMADDKIDGMIKANLALGNEVGVRGTPMFLVGDSVFPGAMQYDQLKDAVQTARKAKK